MKFFETFRKNCAELGLIENARLLNKRFTLNCLIAFTAFLSVFIHVVYVAKTPKEYMHSIYNVGCGFSLAISVASIIIKSKTLFNYMNDLEEFILSREFHVWNFEGKILKEFSLQQLTAILLFLSM